MYRIVFAAVLVLAISPAHATERVAQCLIKVGGKTFLDGKCNVSDGDDTIVVGTTNKAGTFESKYFAYVNKTDAKHALGSWNEDEGSTHAHSSLGTLTLKGSCWVNRKAEICAR